MNEELKPCEPVSCTPFVEVPLETLPWIPTVEELRQAGAAVMTDDGTFYVLRNEQVIHINFDGSEVE